MSVLRRKLALAARGFPERRARGRCWARRARIYAPLLILCCTASFAEAAAVTIDGKLDDAFWSSLPAQKLVPSEPGVPAEIAGEIRAAIAGRHLYVAARLPEPTGRVTARVIGRNPNWEEEDLLQVLAGPDIGYTDRVVKINPFGAYSVERNGQLVHLNADKYLVAARVSELEWTAELALPLNQLSAPGSDPVWISVQRVRARRPGSVPQRWHWPEFGPAAKARVMDSGDWNAPGPVFQPAAIGNNETPLQVGRVPVVPPLDSEWSEPPWRDTPVWRLLLDEALPGAPRFPTELKLLHDGRNLSVMARCLDTRAEGSFGIYLSTSGSAYVQLIVNSTGLLEQATGLTGGSRVSRPREFNGAGRAVVRHAPGGWIVRVDIPLDPVARVLGESGLPTEWRVLFRRIRPAREGDPAETSVLPVIESATPLCPARYRRLALVNAVTSRPREALPVTFDGRVVPSQERAALGLADMVQRQIRSRIRAIAEEQERAWKLVKTRADWERFREPRLKALAASLGEFPKRVPLETKVTQEFPGEGYRRQDLVYQSRPGLWVTANLYLPPPATPILRPGIIVVHSHHCPRTQSELQDMGIVWARAGAVVLIMDQIGHGERMQIHPWNREFYHSRYWLGMQLYLAGESLIKWMVWDIMRGVDLLLERKDVAPDKIILLGSVAGGGEPAAVAAALDDRIAAVAPFNFGRSDPGSGEWESTRCLRRSIVDGFFPWVICAAVAPRRLIYSNEMGIENYRNPEAWYRYEKIFELYGARDHLDEAHGFGTFPGPGECNNIGPAQRQTLYPELNRWFGIPIPPSEPEDRRPEVELWSLTAEVTASLGMRSIHELAREIAQSRLDAARKQLAGLSPAERRTWLRRHWARKLGDIDPNSPPGSTTHWKRPFQNAEMEGITLDVEPGIMVPMILLRPATGASGRLPVVVAVSQEGKEKLLTHRRDDVLELLKAGAAVCLPDVRGVGETSPDQRRVPGGAGMAAAATELMLGNTLLGARLKDLRSVLAYLAARPDLDPQRVALWGDSVAPVNPPRMLLEEIPNWQIGPDKQRQAEPLGGLLAILGALYEDRVRAVAVRRGLVGYRSILEDRFIHVPFDVIVPGILEVGDISDVAESLAPRPLLLEELVDGRNRRVPEPALHGELASLRKTYSTSPSALVIRAEERAGHLAGWLAAQF